MLCGRLVGAGSFTDLSQRQNGRLRPGRSAARGLEQRPRFAVESRFGNIPAPVLTAIAAADLDTLDTRFRRALAAPGLAEVGIVPQEPPR